MKKIIIRILTWIFGKKRLIDLAFEIIDKQVSKIPYSPLVPYLRGHYERLKNFIQIFLDKNLDDASQIKEWFSVEKLPITDETLDFMRAVARLEIKDDIKLEKFLAFVDKIDPIPNNQLPLANG